MLYVRYRVPRTAPRLGHLGRARCYSWEGVRAGRSLGLCFSEATRCFVSHCLLAAAAGHDERVHARDLDRRLQRSLQEHKKQKNGSGSS